MKKKLLILLSALMLTSTSVSTVDAAEVSIPILSVSGEGRAQCQPDRAVINIGVATFNRDAAAAQNENAKISNDIQRAIQSVGIDVKDIQTRNYSFNPKYNYEGNKRNEIEGYTVDNTVVVVVNDVNMVGKVIDISLNSGANKINSLQFSVKNPEPLRKEALQNAIKDARSKAEVIAAGLGMKIKGVSNVSEHVGMISPREFSNTMMMKASMDGAAGTAISAGSLELEAGIQIDFIIE